MPGHQQALILSLGAGPRSFQLTSSSYFLAGGGAGQKSGISHARISAKFRKTFFARGRRSRQQRRWRLLP